MKNLQETILKKEGNVPPLLKRLCATSAMNQETFVFFHAPSSFGLDDFERKCAPELRITLLLAKLSSGDTIGIKIKCHSLCFAALFNRHPAASIAKARKSKEKNSNTERHGTTLAESYFYIDETNTDLVHILMRMIRLFFNTLWPKTSVVIPGYN